MSHFDYKQLKHPKFKLLSIRDLYKQTFGDSESEEEGATIAELSLNLIEQTPAKDLYVFVATETNDAATGIVGCIMFSRLTFAEHPHTTAFVLGPVAVHTAYQGKGIGQSLIRLGLEVLASKSVDLAITYGDPKYYSRIGFHQVPTEVIPSPLPLQYPEGWQAQSLKGDGIIKPISGASACVPAFRKPEYW